VVAPRRRRPVVDEGRYVIERQLPWHDYPRLVATVNHGQDPHRFSQGKPARRMRRSPPVRGRYDDVGRRGQHRYARRSARITYRARRAYRQRADTERKGKRDEGATFTRRERDRAHG
jgi:hypothetical protein